MATCRHLYLTLELNHPKAAYNTSTWRHRLFIMFLCCSVTFIRLLPLDTARLMGAALITPGLGTKDVRKLLKELCLFT